MDDDSEATRYLTKAVKSLAGAHSEFTNGRFDNSANRSYYACFQAAIATLIQAGIRPEKRVDRWQHTFVIGRFNGDLIYRRKKYSAKLRSTLHDLQTVRHTADYRPGPVSEIEAYGVLSRARAFVLPIQSSGDFS